MEESGQEVHGTVVCATASRSVRLQGRFCCVNANRLHIVLGVWRVWVVCMDEIMSQLAAAVWVIVS